MSAAEPDNDGLKKAKALLRRTLRRQRAAIPEDERATMDAAICSKTLALPTYQRAALILTYLSVGSEVDTRAIIRHAWKDGKTVAIPRCMGPREMRWFRIDTFEGLERTSFGTFEPLIDETQEVLPAETDEHVVALVPGFSFDGEGYRLGYGGGYYDTFLADFKGTSIGLCRSCQLSAEPLPREPYDLPVNMVVND